MIRNVFLLPLLAGAILLSACSLPTREADTIEAPDDGSGTQSAQPDKPREVELTSELLFDLLVAELANQRGGPGVAAHSYLKSAKKNPGCPTGTPRYPLRHLRAGSRHRSGSGPLMDNAGSR